MSEREQKVHCLQGTVLKVDVYGNRLLIDRDGSKETVHVGTGTVTLDGRGVTLPEIKPGQRVKVNMVVESVEALQSE